MSSSVPPAASTTALRFSQTWRLWQAIRFDVAAGARAAIFCGSVRNILNLLREGGETTMSDFRTYQRANRMPAVPMQPVIDPAGWLPDSLGPVQDWAYRISGQDQDELLAAVDAFRKHGFPLPDVNRENFPLGKLKDVLADIRRELIDGRGLVMVQN